MGVVLLILIVFLVIMCIGANFMKKVAEAKGYGDEYNIFAICFFLGIVGYIYVLALPDLILREQMKTIADSLKNQGQSEWPEGEELPEL